MKNIVIKGWMVALIIFVCMFGGIYLTIGTGHWTTTRSKEPVKLESGEYDIADMRGSYTFAEIEQFFGVPADLLFQAFLIPDEKRTETFSIKDMKDGLFEPVVLDGAEIEVGTDLVRVFTSLYAGLPYESEETTHLPETAVNILLQEQTLDAEQQGYWKSHTFQLAAAGQGAGEEAQPQAEVSEPHADGDADSSPAESSEESNVLEIKGRTTLGELLEFGLTREQFKEISGMDVPEDTATKLKDFVETNGLDMETLRTKFSEALETQR